MGSQSAVLLGYPESLGNGADDGQRPEGTYLAYTQPYVDRWEETILVPNTCIY